MSISFCEDGKYFGRLVSVFFKVLLNGSVLIFISLLIISLLNNTSPLKLADLAGSSFVQKRYLGVIWLGLPVVGLAEWCGIRYFSHKFSSGFRNSSPRKILLSYYFFRFCTASAGLSTLGGHAQMVRPIVYPALESQATKLCGNLTLRMKQILAVEVSATDNVANFFGQSLFMGVSSILLMQEIMERAGYLVTPLELVEKSIPCVVIASVVHCLRLVRINKKLLKLNHSQNGAG